MSARPELVLGAPGGAEYDEAVVRRSADVLTELSRRLYSLAAGHDEQAMEEAEESPYWAPVPATEASHRFAATALRACARSLELEARMWGFA